MHETYDTVCGYKISCVNILYCMSGDWTYNIIYYIYNIAQYVLHLLLSMYFQKYNIVYNIVTLYSLYYNIVYWKTILFEVWTYDIIHMILYVNYLYIAGLAGAQGRPARWATRTKGTGRWAPNTSAPGAGRGARGAKKECPPWIKDTELPRFTRKLPRVQLCYRTWNPCVSGLVPTL